MALGDSNYSNSNNNSGNEGNGKIIISHFSGYGSANSMARSACSKLMFSFYGRTLKITIAPMIKIENDIPVYDYKKENTGIAYLNHTKARILRQAILSMKDDSSISNVGVPTSDKLVTFTNGKELGINSPALIIRELDQNSGQVLSTYIYEFKTNDDYYSVNNFVEETTSYDRVFYNNIEVEQFLDLLEQYYKAATGAYAYATTDAIVNCREIGGAIRDIASQVGVPNNTSRANYGNRSFFNNNNGGGAGSFRQGTLDSMREA